MILDRALVDRLVGQLDATGERSDVIAPFTGECEYSLPTSTVADVDRALESLRRGQTRWAATPVRERAAALLRFHDLVLTRREEILDIIQAETGKARRDAMEEVLDVCINARHYARDAPRLLKPRRHTGALPVVVGVTEYRVPKGVVGVLSPWNYPLSLSAGDAIPALMAGNAVLLKPDLQTTLTAVWAVELLIEAGVPRDAIALAPGDGPVVGPWVIDRVDYVMFTGSTRVGREVASRCGQRLVGCSLELGGKNAMIIRADADPHRAAEIATRACFSNAGQLCISMERIYVADEVYEEFTRAFAASVAALTMASAVGWSGQMGSLTSQRQLDRVLAHIADATGKGAAVLAGGAARPDIAPFAVEPTVLDGVTDDMVLCDEETFGPVVALYRVSDDEQAVRLANDSPYGLNAAVVTRDRRAGRTIARRLHAGSVNINEGYGASWASVRAPMGGMGDSGLGRRHGDEGLLKYTESQTIAEQRMLGLGAPQGWSDERWTGLLATAIGTMKRLGLK